MVKAARFSESDLDNFENAMDLREEADYALSFSEDSARRVVRDAAEFAKSARRVLKKSPMVKRKAS